MNTVKHAAALALIAALLVSSSPALAQFAAATAMVDDPCPPRIETPPTPAQEEQARLMLEPGHPGMAEVLRAQKEASWHKPAAPNAAPPPPPDWPNLCRSRAANTALKTRPVAVLMGDSITDGWIKGDPAFFAVNNFADRGISGQTSSQMLLRFSNDVLALHPDVVQILAGTNDVAGNTGPLTAQDYKHNIMAMVALARARKIRVVIGAIPPATSFWWAPEIQPSAKIQELNVWLKTYAAKEKLVYVDFYRALAAPDGSLDVRYSNDGVHPNRDGYAVMGALSRKAIKQAQKHRAR